MPVVLVVDNSLSLLRVVEADASLLELAKHYASTLCRNVRDLKTEEECAVGDLQSASLIRFVDPRRLLRVIDEMDFCPCVDRVEAVREIVEATVTRFVDKKGTFKFFFMTDASIRNNRGFARLKAAAEEFRAKVIVLLLEDLPNSKEVNEEVEQFRHSQHCVLEQCTPRAPVAPNTSNSSSSTSTAKLLASMVDRQKVMFLVTHHCGTYRGHLCFGNLTGAIQLNPDPSTVLLLDEPMPPVLSIHGFVRSEDLSNAPTFRRFLLIPDAVNRSFFDVLALTLKQMQMLAVTPLTTLFMGIISAAEATQSDKDLLVLFLDIVDRNVPTPWLENTRPLRDLAWFCPEEKFVIEEERHNPSPSIIQDVDKEVQKLASFVKDPKRLTTAKNTACSLMRTARVMDIPELEEQVLEVIRKAHAEVKADSRQGSLLASLLEDFEGHQQAQSEE